ncbi:U3 small nucleolar RNA-associated protein 8 [Dipodascopsis uninucleata]
MSSIALPYTICGLPATASEKSVFVSSSKSNIVDIAISTAAVQRHVLRPAPRLVSSIAVSPLSEFICAAVLCDTENKHDINAGGSNVYAYVAVKERKNIFVRRMNENSQTLEYPVSEEVKGLYVLKKAASDIVIVLLISGVIVALSAELTEEGNSKEELREQWRYSIFDDMSKTIEYSELLKQDVLFISARDNDQQGKVTVKQMTLNEVGILEIESWNIVTDLKTINSIRYHSSGVLFLQSGLIIEAVTLFTIARTTIDLSSLVKKATTGDISFIPASKTSLLVNTGNNFLLVNWQYKILMAEVSLPGHFTILGRIGKGSAIGISSKKEIQLVPYSVGSGSILECVTGNVKIVNSNSSGINKMAAFTNILFKERTSSRRYKADVEGRSSSARSERDYVMEQLKLLKNSNNVEEWEIRVIPYLTEKEDWKEFKDEKFLRRKSKAQERDQDYQQKLTEIERSSVTFRKSSSRIVDPILLHYVASLVFERRSDRTLELSAFYPERTILYLLSHPLFPINQYPELLDTISSKPRLLIHSLKFTGGLSASSLAKSLLSHVVPSILNPTIVRLSIKRLVDGFNYPTIVNAFQQYSSEELENALLSLTNYFQAEKFDLDSWGIVSCLIDASGLLSLRDDTINKLTTSVDEVVSILQYSIDTLQIVDTAIQWAKRREKRSKTNTSNGPNSLSQLRNRA